MLTTTSAASIIRGKATARHEGEVMKLVILRDTFIDGQLARTGETVEVPDTVARELIAMKKAVELTEEIDNQTAKMPEPNNRENEIEKDWLDDEFEHY